MCSRIDARAPNSKLWRLAKSFSIDQPQVKGSSIVLDSVGQVIWKFKGLNSWLNSGLHHQKHWKRAASKRSPSAGVQLSQLWDPVQLYH
ncbi:hypothetical protein TNCV_4999641 [Trichonephila clavipes]|nr:hypothetical protein TNCV_4999641 [Trichonephila clavipes]